MLRTNRDQILAGWRESLSNKKRDREKREIKTNVDDDGDLVKGIDSSMRGQRLTTQFTAYLCPLNSAITVPPQLLSLLAV